MWWSMYECIHAYQLWKTVLVLVCGCVLASVWLIYDFGRWSLKPLDSGNIVTNVHDVAACEYVKITHPCHTNS